MDQHPTGSAASRGGAARMSQLDHAGRQALGRKAAEARWGRKKDSDQQTVISDQDAKTSVPAIPAGAAPPPVATPAYTVQPVRPARRAARPPVRPKPFRGAHSYAEKRLAEAIKERAQAMNKLSMLEAEIPSLVAIIKALQNTPPGAGRLGVPDERSLRGGVMTGGGAPPDLGLTARPTRINRAQGGAMDVNLGVAGDDEDMFLRDSMVAEGEWH